MMLCCLVKNCQVISLRILWPDLDLIDMTLIWHLVLTVTFFLLVITFSLGFINFFFSFENLFVLCAVFESLLA